VTDAKDGAGRKRRKDWPGLPICGEPSRNGPVMRTSSRFIRKSIAAFEAEIAELDTEIAENGCRVGRSAGASAIVGQGVRPPWWKRTCVTDLQGPLCWKADVTPARSAELLSYVPRSIGDRTSAAGTKGSSANVPPTLCAIGRNRYRDSRCAGCLADSVATGESINSGEAEPSITMAAAKSSSTVEHELRCFGRSRRSPASVFA
jgi:hypothetical protein